VRIVGSHHAPEAIPDHEIESLHALAVNGARYDHHPFLKEGMLVKIVRGPLSGVTGRLIRHARHYRLVISITLIQRAVAVEVEAADVAPAENAAL
jgi:transcription antitermination factor NusG